MRLPWGLGEDESVGGRLGPSNTGLGPVCQQASFQHRCSNLKFRDPILQAWGRERARVLLMGSWRGTLAVIMRQVQSLPVVKRVLNELQQLEDGEEDPLLLLPVIKFRHGVTLEIMEGVHDVVIICPFTEIPLRDVKWVWWPWWCL